MTLTSEATLAPALWNRNRPFPATLIENRRLNGPGSRKDTRHLVISLAGSGLTYSCGDSLGVYAQNDPAEVQAILDLLAFTGNEPVLPAGAAPETQPIPLRQALMASCAIDTCSRKFLDFLRERLPAGPALDKIAGLLHETNTDACKAWLEERHCLDILREVAPVVLNPQDFVSQLRKLQPRLYSIASAPSVYPDEIHLTVAVVRYTWNGRVRQGVASSWLADRAPLNEPQIPVFVASSHFGLPEDNNAPMIMVGPGTGVAPFRSFVHERLHRGAKGKLWLFFGDQHRATDYLYGDEWETLHRQGKLHRLDLAFSRDQDHKIYVQDRMRQASRELYAWLQEGGYFYVCGDASRMAKDVDAALHAIFCEEGKMDAEAAKEVIRRLKKEKRYQRDVY